MTQILFASDFGPGSEWVGTCHAVMAAIAPESRVLDLTHSLTPFDVTGAATVLADILPFASPSIAVLVVDPGVGSQRRALALRCGRGDILIGPDNGLLTGVASSVGSVLAARELSNLKYQGRARSKTFHARDIFCPVAAHLSLGTRFEELGQELDSRDLVAALPPRMEVSGGLITCEVINIDRFGNVRLPLKADVLEEARMNGREMLAVSAPGGDARVRNVTTFSELTAGEIGLLEDSFGWLCLAMFGASAATRLGLARGSVISLR